MKDNEVDKHLQRFTWGAAPSEDFRQRVLTNSTAEFLRIRRRRLTLRTATAAAAAVLIAGFAFICGRLSVSHAFSGSNRSVRQVYVEPGNVSVPEELVAWLNAAQMFKRLGMQDRMARSVERAAGFIPDNTTASDNRNMSMFAADFDTTEKEPVQSRGMQGPQPSLENINQIISQAVILEIEK